MFPPSPNRRRCVVPSTSTNSHLEPIQVTRRSTTFFSPAAAPVIGDFKKDLAMGMPFASFPRRRAREFLFMSLLGPAPQSGENLGRMVFRHWILLSPNFVCRTVSSSPPARSHNPSPRRLWRPPHQIQQLSSFDSFHSFPNKHTATSSTTVPWLEISISLPFALYHPAVTRL
ncbi:hypothetical protein ARMSODRAFT_1019393 [Armillaria solidipes]|uniref:Uncharacterized protein n=1 Tax=Armillaria solidipes TaxID=1076256 RepID=A0A2H3BY40_9AGAR|nr:hypothetical protein ARMSODRAFT_1019393 [Armillaria solidipes]